MTVVEGKLKPLVAKKFAKNVKSHGGHRRTTVMKKSIILQGQRNRKSQGGQWSPPIYCCKKLVSFNSVLSMILSEYWKKLEETFFSKWYYFEEIAKIVLSSFGHDNSKIYFWHPNIFGHSNCYTTRILNEWINK